MLMKLIEWVKSTGLHVFLDAHYSGILPVTQAIHLMSVGVVLTSIFLMVTRILGWTAANEPIPEVMARYKPWFKSGLVVLVVTGVLMIFTEPAREFLDPLRVSTPENEIVNLPFWIKMVLLLIGTMLVSLFFANVRRRPEIWNAAGGVATGTKVLAVVMLFGWFLILLMGRLIAYPDLLY